MPTERYQVYEGGRELWGILLHVRGALVELNIRPGNPSIFPDQAELDTWHTGGKETWLVRNGYPKDLV